MTLTDVRIKPLTKMLVAAAAITTIAVAAPASADTDAQAGRVKDLGTLAGGNLSWAYGINEGGVITGYSEDANGKSHAVRWDRNGKISDLGLLPGYAESMGFTINNSGVVAGRAYNGHVTSERATVWDATGKIKELPTLPAAKLNRAYAINDAGTVVGVSSNSANVFQAVRWNTDGTLTKLRGPQAGEPFSGAGWINANGVTSGFWGTEAILWGPEADPEPKVLENLTLPSGPTIDKAYAINDKGLAVGAAVDKGAFSHPVRWTKEGKVSELKLLPGDVGGAAYGISNDGYINGYSMNAVGVHRAVRWSPDGTITLLVDITTPSEGYMINDSSAVVGVTTTRGNKIHAAVWR
jgi:probable HAF family extracellular repeat protein